MSVERDQREQENAATSDSWLARLVAFVVWLLDAIAGLKRIRRTTRFKPTWRDHWDGLRQLEWQRHQVLAQGAALLLSGKTLNDADFIPHPVPEDFGGPCPATPFEMNRRFLAVMTFIRNPETHIWKNARRIARRAGIALSSDPLRLAAAQRSTSPTCVASEGGYAPALLASLSAQHWGRWIAASSRRDGGGLSANRARAPPAFPYSLFAIPYSPQTLRV